MKPSKYSSPTSIWEKWELADLDEQGHAEDGLTHEAANQPLSAGEAAVSGAKDAAMPPELDAVRQAASEAARHAGFEAGRADGFTEGRKAGFDEGRAAGFEEGRKAGREQGEREGFETGKARADTENDRLKSQAEALAAVAGKLELALRDFNNNVADELLALALELAHQVIRGEISARPETILTVVREALTRLPHQHASIYLHPEDASLLRSYAGDTLTHAGHRIHEDALLARGDCLIEAGVSQIDASLAERWRRVIESLGLEHAWQSPNKK